VGVGNGLAKRALRAPIGSPEGVSVSFPPSVANERWNVCDRQVGGQPVDRLRELAGK